MKRTISAMVGKGSVNHNSRKFKAENVDGSRTHLNVDYCNENIKTVYHKMFDEALKRYNDKQTRADRKIENYYEKIRNSKQEKPFHELILQIGDKENMSAESENGELARQILNEYYRGFQERNPQLKVFSAHLHMDEATPHLHIDFRLLRKVFGSQQIDALISQAKEQEQQRKHTKQPSNQRTKRIRNNDFER